MGNLSVFGHNCIMQKGPFLLGTKSSPPSGGAQKQDTQPSQTCSEGYTLPATALQRGVSLYLRSINRLDPLSEPDPGTHMKPPK